MSSVYRIFGNELSPYSVKVRSYLRYKGIPHEWVVRTVAHEEEFRRLAKLPLIPLVVAPDGSVLQDSTPIIETLEARYPEPAIVPPDPALAFVSALLEEYADEWGNKPMFHYRWFREIDQQSGAERIARSLNPEMPADVLPTAIEAVKARMIPRLRFVGSTPETAGVIEASFRRELRLLEAHLAGRSYCFGGRPALADFGLWGQLYELSSDPTPGAILRAEAPAVLAWIERMLNPRSLGDWEPWETLEPTLQPLLREEVGGVFLPWTRANARALEAGESSFRVTLHGAVFSQEPQRYHAKSFGVLRQRYAAVPDRGRLDAILERAGCLAGLRD